MQRQHFASSAELRKVWSFVKADRRGKKALALLREDGFHLVDQRPAFYCRIPYLSADRLVGRMIELDTRAFDGMIKFLREAADLLNSPHPVLVHSEPKQKKFVSQPGIKWGFPYFRGVANSLEWIAARRWAVTEHSQQDRVIAVLLQEVMEETGKPHYKEIGNLLDAIFRGAGKEFTRQRSALFRSIAPRPKRAPDNKSRGRHAGNEISR
jgi:hypothetical protein